MSISNEEITASLDKIRSSTVKRLVATGGEIFLFPEQLKHVIKEARKRGLAVNLNTNGYWGKSVESAQERLKFLTECGWSNRDLLVVSAGQYHQEWVSLTAIQTLIREYHAHFAGTMRPVFISIEYDQSSTKDIVAEFVELAKDLPEKSYRLAKERSNLYRFGRDIALTNVALKNYKKFNFPCVTEIVSVHPDKTVYPCCGFNYNNPGLSIGNIDEKTIKDIIADARDSFIVKLLLNINFSEVYQALKDVDNKLPSFFSNKCELCEIITRSEYREMLETKFKDRLI
jgi:MoaA/NifB/PqqE/SkfB family radical SAM enzyme